MLKDSKGDVRSKQPMSGPKLAETTASGLVPVSEMLPPSLMLLPVSHTTLFPGMIVPFILPEGKLTKTVEYAASGTGYVGVVVTKAPGEVAIAAGPSTSIPGMTDMATVAMEVGELPRATGVTVEGKEGDYFTYGVAAKILKKINLPDNQVSVLLAGLQRFEITDLVGKDPYVVANVKYLFEQLVRDTELEAMLRSALGQFKQISKDNPLISEEVKVALVNIDGPGKLADFMASVLVRDIRDYQELLAAPDVKARLQKLLLLLKKELDVQTIQKKIQEDINEKVSSAQKEFYLQEQLKSIQKELGSGLDDKSKLLDKFSSRLKGKELKPEAKTRINEEMEKLATLHEQSSEYSVSINYIDWATSLPWGVRTKENYDLKGARKILDEDHYGLKDVKERVLEFLAVKKLKHSSEGSILCFVGPPGTGKTSLGRSIAQALNRKFFRFSVGGMRDEAEIKGHRRTYVGAMPGKLIQGLKRVGSQNPVFLIDEVDKISTGWASGGDPASALLELLDPEQNPEFLDHYLDIPFDCSDVFFITTANTTDTIPNALLDRMEIIPVHGYTDIEKFHIAKKHLLPKQIKKNALKSSSIHFSDAAIRHLISQYAREAGVRNLEKQLAKICRKVAYRVAMGRAKTVNVSTAADIERFLGMAPFAPEVGFRKMVPGVATGLAWTQYGGEVLFIESMAVEGKAGGLRLTGSLGEVMQESANIAYTYVRDRARRNGVHKGYFDGHVLHLHVPSGATPKDGPSAGVTMAASLYSLVSNKTPKPGIAMTGELTLTGRVLPVGGIKEKLLAAKRAGMKTVLIPKHNEKDLKEIEPEVKASLNIIKISTMDDCLRHLFPR